VALKDAQLEGVVEAQAEDEAAARHVERVCCHHARRCRAVHCLEAAAMGMGAYRGGK